MLNEHVSLHIPERIIKFLTFLNIQIIIQRDTYYQNEYLQQDDRVINFMSFLKKIGRLYLSSKTLFKAVQLYCLL